jgi:hypothetical protein
MQAKHLSSRHATAGSGLVAVLFFLILTSLTVAMVYSITSTNTVVAKRTVDRASAVAYGDGVMESIFDQWRNSLATATDPTDRSSGKTQAALTAAITPPDSTTLPPPPGVSLNSWSIKALTPLLADTTDPNGRPVKENGTSSSLRICLYYMATVKVNFRNSGSNPVVIQRVFSRTGRNIFDNFFFGTQMKTEFHPGPEMYVSGTVYVGGDLYTAHDSLHFMKDVSFTGTQYLDYRTEDSRWDANKTQVDITNGGLGNNWDTNNPPHVGAQQKLLDTPLTSLDPNFIDDISSNDADSDKNPNNDGYHEIIEKPDPNTNTTDKVDPLQLDSSTSERLSQNADYRIEVDASNNVTIYGSNGKLTAGTEYDAIKGALSTNTAIYDAREGDYVRLVTVDVSKINAAAAAKTISDSKGGTNGTGGDGYVLYVADTSGAAPGANATQVTTDVYDSSTGKVATNGAGVKSNHARGVKLVNGGTLPKAGMTVVTPNTVYIQGDYNTGSSSGSQPASNTATSYTPPTDTPSPVVTNYDRAPAAVVGDAVNILSNAWNDANSLSGKTRTATSTTVNTALLAGNVPTTTSSYSGGIENFTRFNEDWSKAYFTIYGALALLYDSEQATGLWNKASYSPPSRRWYYDTNLQNANPPGFRVAHTYSRGNRIGN